LALMERTRRYICHFSERSFKFFLNFYKTQRKVSKREGGRGKKEQGKKRYI